MLKTKLDPFNVELGKQLENVRSARDLTREELLEALAQVTTSPFFDHVTNIRRVEIGETSLKLKNLIILAHVLQADLASLLVGLPGMPEEEEEEEEEELRQTITHHVNLMNYERVEQLLSLLVSKKKRAIQALVRSAHCSLSR